MQNQQIKDFWIQVINELKQYKGVAPNLITENEGNATDDLWQEKLNRKQEWDNIKNYTMEICEDIFQRATTKKDAWVGNDTGALLKYLRDKGINLQASNEFSRTVFNTISDHEREIIDAQTHLEVDDLSDLTTEPEYAMPTGLDLETTLAWFGKYKKIMDKSLDVFATNSAGDKVGVSEGKIDTLIVAKNTIDNITPHLGTTITLPILTTHLTNIGKTLEQMFDEAGELDDAVKAVLNNDLTNFPTRLNQLKTNSDQYTRIHTKLSGKVSDTDLDTFINTPQCSHTDYDAIKSERDTLKTENAELKTDSDAQVANKEKTILEKLITDCNLGLDKSSNLEQVIAKIKELTKAPDTSTEITELKQQKSQLETQLTEKEKTITELQTQKPTEEIKSKVIESSKELGLFNQSFEQKLSKVSSYQELAQLQQEAFKEKLLEKESSLQRLVVVLVLGIAGVVGYFAKKKKIVEGKE